MKLNPDCIRDILLKIEELSSYNGRVVLSINQEPTHPSFEWEEIVYHVRQCEMSGLITPVQYVDCGDTIIISDLTPGGHEFLANIRADTNWSKTKNIAKNVGSFSLDALKSIASNVIAELIKKQSGLSN